MVLAPILTGAITYLLRNRAAKLFLYIFQVIYAGLAFYVFMTVKETGPIVWNVGGYTDGLALSLYADSISIFMVLMTAVFYIAFLVYATREKYFRPRFYFLFMVLQGLMMGLFLSSDLFNIFVFKLTNII